MNFLGPLIFKSSRWVVWSIVSLGTLVGLATSIVTAWSVLAEQRSSERIRFEEEAQNRFSAIAIRLGVARQMMDSCGAYFAGHPAAEENGFRNFARFMLDQNPSINSLAWVPRVAASGRAAWEVAAGDSGHRAIREIGQLGELVPAVERPEYFPIAYAEPNHFEETLRGYDIGSDLGVKSALRAAWRSGRVRASAPLMPLRRKRINNEFLLMAPIFTGLAPASSPPYSAEQLSGIVLAQIRLPEVLYPVLDGFKPVGILIELNDNLVPPQDRRIFMYSDGSVEVPVSQDGLQFKRQLTFAGQSWSVHCVPLPGFYRQNVYLIPGLVLLGGLITTGTLAALLANLFRQGWRVERLVEERTAQLERSNGILRQEIESRIQVEGKLSLSLAEKGVLLREVQHRVRNNLQFICSLIHLQAGHVVDGEGVRMAGTLRSQVRSMALVYERLQSETLATIDFGEYVRNLAEEILRASNRRGQEITLCFQLERTPLNLDTAVPCGLIVNELLASTFEHAFLSGRNGEAANTVTVSLRGSGKDEHVLTVEDNGCSPPEQVDLSSSTFDGLQVVALLVEQLNGKMTLEQNGGTRCVVTFREIHYPTRT